MVSFRRIVLAMAVLALFVGLAGAQVGVGTGSTAGTLSCTAFVSVPPTLRAEGLTELVGDIVIQCTGGSITTVAGGQVPTANFTVSLNTNMTSRLLSSNITEALLLVDEPGSGEPGAGPLLPQTVCSSASIGAGSGGCTTFFNSATQSAALCTGTVTSGICPTFGAVPNVYQGINTAINQVTFNGVPILAPVTSGLTRVFRITNVRADANLLGGGGLPGTTGVLASISISGSTALPVSNPVQTVGFIQTGLAARVRNNTNSSSSTIGFQQCGSTGTTGSAGPASAALLEFKEGFATAFKTRVATTASYNGTGLGVSTFTQNVPAVNYNSESGLILTTPNGTAGLADFGTRLRAVFNNIPAGVSVYVTTTNLAGNNGAANGTTVVANTAVVNGATSPTVAVMVPNESGVSLAGLNVSGSTFTGVPGAVFSQVPIVSGSGEAVWEIVQANPSAIDTVQFGVLYVFTGNQATNTPPAGTSTVNLNFAPALGVGNSGLTQSSAITAQGSGVPIPRFADTSTSANILVISLCQTDLLFPFVTNANGFDTGIAIANTTSDPFGTTAQSGTCSFNWYGSGAPSTSAPTAVIANGTDYANTASTLAPGFQGYMIAVCNFQYAHGFAFISDVGARNLAMGYLALVMNGGGAINARGQAAEAFAQ